MEKIKIDCILSHCPLHGRQVIPPWGNESADIMLIGDSPGKEEEKRNRPFVGKVGKKLYDAARAAGINWQDLYMTNAVKCRIWDTDISREGIVQALACCRGYMEYAILSSKPVVIITNGTFAFSQIAPHQPFPQLLGEWTWSETFKCKVIPILPEHHDLDKPELEATERLSVVFKVAGSMI